jgi:hypothetical protein
MKPIFVLYEGAHDSAFLLRLLQSCNIEPYKEMLKDYSPRSLAKFLVNRYERQDIAHGRFRPAGKNRGAIVAAVPPVFEAAFHLKTPDRLLLLHRCNGDGQVAAINAFLSELVELSKPGAADIGLKSFGVVFMLDADDHGVAGRVAMLKERHSEALRPVLPSFERIHANSSDGIVRDGNFSAGCWVHCKGEEDFGTLEDILWPMLHTNIGSRLDDALNYIDDHALPGTEILRGARATVKKTKAALSIAGQIDAPGYSLSVALRDMPAFDDKSIGQSLHCQAVLEILRTV